eukprot:3939452-Rhodomonas_salina.1
MPRHSLNLEFQCRVFVMVPRACPVVTSRSLVPCAGKQPTVESQRERKPFSTAGLPARQADGV